jgi:hypothetical protein
MFGKFEAGNRIRRTMELSNFAVILWWSLVLLAEISVAR